jgi:hypothetical protein
MRCVALGQNREERRGTDIIEILIYRGFANIGGGEKRRGGGEKVQKVAKSVIRVAKKNQFIPVLQCAGIIVILNFLSYYQPLSSPISIFWTDSTPINTGKG